MTRAQLDAQMEQTLRQLARCSHVPACGYEPSGRSGATKSVALDGGDTGADFFAAHYGPPFAPESAISARTDARRQDWLEAARRELRSSQGHGLAEVKRPAGETRAQLDARIVADGEGYTVAEAAVRFRCGPRDIQRARRNAGRELDRGGAPGVHEPSDGDLRQRILALRASHTVRAIEMLTGVPRSTVHRYLKDAA